MPNKKLYRSNNRFLAGVCGGIAEYFDVDPTIIRLIFAAVTLFSAIVVGTIFYLVCWIIIPQERL